MLEPIPPNVNSASTRRVMELKHTERRKCRKRDGGSFEHNPTRCRQATEEGRSLRGGAHEPTTMEASVSEGELYRLQRALERLMAGHREAVGVVDRGLEDREEPSAQETLAEVQDILSGALEDAQTILEGGRA